MSADAHTVADDQVRSAFHRWKNLEEEKARIADDLKELFAEQKAFGHDTKAMRAAFRLKVKMDEADPADAEHEALVDTYLAVLDAPRATRAYARENIEKFDAETGEILDGDVSAKLVATVAAGMRTEIGRAALIAAVDIMIDREEAEERRADGGLNIQTKHEDIRSGGSSSVPSSLATREAEESVVSNPEMDRATEGSFETGSEAAEKGREAIPAGPEGADLNHAGAGESPAINITIPSAERVTPHGLGSAAANAGGDDADGGAERATHLVTGEGTACALPTNGVTLEYVPASGVKRLPFARCFPELSKADYERLERDIAANRVQIPIIRRDDVIIDGWARYMISRQYGMAYPVIEHTGTDILLDVIELQRAARNFTPAQEKKIAADLAKEFPHRAEEIMAAFGHVEQTSEEEAA